MVEIIIFAVITWAVFRKIKRSAAGDSAGQNRRRPDVSATTAQSAPDHARREKTPPRGDARPPMKKGSMQEAIEEAKEDGHSTTAYLMEKAQEDAREHAREKYEEQKRLSASRGGLPVAERYLYGDSVPQGKKIVNCGYCGAENLIPMTPKSRYSCYFCRETL